MIHLLSRDLDFWGGKLGKTSIPPFLYIFLLMEDGSMAVKEEKKDLIWIGAICGVIVVVFVVLKIFFDK